MNQKISTKLVINKITKLKTKTKKEELITFENPTGILSAFEFLYGYVKNDSDMLKLEIYSTEFGYQLLNSDGTVKFEYTIEEV
jgi:hypothetical protein